MDSENGCFRSNLNGSGFAKIKLLNTEVRAPEHACNGDVTARGTRAGTRDGGDGEIPAARRSLSSEGDLRTFDTGRRRMVEHGAVMDRHAELPAANSFGA